MNRVEVNYVKIDAWNDLEPFQDSLVSYNQVEFPPENYYRVPNSSLPFFGYVSKEAYEYGGQAGYFLNPLCTGIRGESTLVMVNSYIQTKQPFYMTFANGQQTNSIVTALNEGRACFATPIGEEDLSGIVERNVLALFENNQFEISLDLANAYVQSKRSYYPNLPNPEQMRGIVNTINTESKVSLIPLNLKTGKELIEDVIQRVLFLS